MSKFSAFLLAVVVALVVGGSVLVVAADDEHEEECPGHGEQESTVVLPKEYLT